MASATATALAHEAMLWQAAADGPWSQGASSAGIDGSGADASAADACVASSAFIPDICMPAICMPATGMLPSIRACGSMRQPTPVPASESWSTKAIKAVSRVVVRRSG